MSIKIVEVSPRDGFQSIPNFIPTEVKLDFINELIKTGVKSIEATSFVSPKWVPQMADHAEIMKQLATNQDVQFPVLVPNQQGLEHAIRLGVKDIAVFTAASNTFSIKNTNKNIDNSLSALKEVIQEALRHKITVRGYVSCVLGCPYEGPIKIDQVVSIATHLFEAGCHEISLGDTIGIGTPNTAVKLFNAVKNNIPLECLALHFHDTYGQALANIYACLEVGAQIIDASVAGLGGCPYAKGASGNVATEDVLYMLKGLGLKTDIDLNAMIDAGHKICHYLQRPNLSKVALALKN